MACVVEQEARMGSSDYHITIVIDRRDMGLAAGDLDMFKAFFKVGLLGDKQGGAKDKHTFVASAGGQSPLRHDETIMIDHVSLPVCLCTQTFAELYPMKLYRVCT